MVRSLALALVMRLGWVHAIWNLLGEQSRAASTLVAVGLIVIGRFG